MYRQLTKKKKKKREKKSRTTVYISARHVLGHAVDARRKASENVQWDAHYRVNNVYTRQTVVDEINGTSDTISTKLVLFLFLFLINTFCSER